MNTVKIENAYITLVDGDRGKNYPKQNDLSSTGDCLFLSAKNVTKEGFIFNEICFISSEKDSQLRAGKLERGDIVITTRGTIGNIAYFHENIPYQNIRINSGMLIIRADENYWDKYFLFIYLSSKIFQNQLETFISGSAVPQLPAKDLKKMLLPKIALNTQIKIRKIIKSFNDKITLNTQTNQTLEQIAQAIFKHWFIDFAPVHAKANALARGETIEQAELAAMACLSGKTAEKITTLKTQDPTTYHQLQQTAAAFPSEFVETEIGQVPKGWEVKKIDEVIQKIPVGKKYSQKTTVPDGKIPVLDQGKSGIIGYHNNIAGVKASIQDPVIVFANHTCYMRLIHFDFSAIQNVFAFKGQSINIYWLYLATLGKQTFVEYKGHFPDFLIKQIVVPPKELTEIFGNLVQNSFSKIALNLENNAILAKTRDLLLPKLLNGEVEL